MRRTITRLSLIMAIIINSVSALLWVNLSIGVATFNVGVAAAALVLLYIYDRTEPTSSD